MKYLYLIIRHLFPRSKWKHIKTVDVYGSLSKDKPESIIYIYQDQFGNIKREKIG